MSQGSASDFADFDRCETQLGTLLEDACPVCSRALEGDVVRCEACYVRRGEGFVCRSCGVPFGGDDRLVTDPADASYWLCTVDYLKEKVLGTEQDGIACPGWPSGTRSVGACLAASGGVAVIAESDGAGSNPAVSTTVLRGGRYGNSLTSPECISTSHSHIEIHQVREVAGRGSGATALQSRFLLAQRPRDDNFSRGAGSSVEAQSAGGGIPGGRRLESSPVLRLTRNVTAHHIAQAIVAAALARDLSGGRV